LKDDSDVADNARTALISYAAKARVEKGLNGDHNIDREMITLTPKGATNIHHALTQAQDLSWRSDSDVRKYIVLLTDGFPNRHSSSGSSCSPSYPEYPDDYSESNTGNTCIKSALDLAAELKNDSNNITVYTIGLGLDSVHGYVREKQIDMAHFILDRIASSPPSQYAHYLPSKTRTEWETDTELQDVYREILHQMLSNPYLRIQECPAGSDCPTP